jgi:hypothetical protein
MSSQDEGKRAFIKKGDNMPSTPSLNMFRVDTLNNVGEWNGAGWSVLQINLRTLAT